MKYLPIIIAAITLLSFDSVTTSSDLKGKWVDLVTKTDTLTFASDGEKEYFMLGRGLELKNGHTTAKSCYGLYAFKLLPGDRISFSWIYSSVAESKDYHFKKTGNVIEIEEFYCMKQPGKMLTFGKLN